MPMTPDKATANPGRRAAGEQAERAVAAARVRRPDWPAPTVTELALVVSTRDRAHGRPGHWTETPAEAVQYQLF